MKIQFTDDSNLAGNAGVTADTLNIQNDFDRLTEEHKVGEMNSSPLVLKYH